MADISKCSNAECPIRLKCYRFIAKSSYYQSWSNFKYNSGCLHFWENKHKLNKLNEEI